MNRRNFLKAAVAAALAPSFAAVAAIPSVRTLGWSIESTGLDTGLALNNSTYHIFAVKRMADGVLDYAVVKEGANGEVRAPDGYCITRYDGWFIS